MLPIRTTLFYSPEKEYLEHSFQHLFASEHYIKHSEETSIKRMHSAQSRANVIDLNPTITFTPSFFEKQLLGSPLQVDLSANFLLYETLNLGVNYRWDDSNSTLYCYKIFPEFDIGYSYNYSSNRLNLCNSGGHEVFFTNVN